MGERATIRVIQSWSDTPIHFYTHWNGHEIAEILAHGLYLAKETGRLEDESYATRIVFDTLTGLEGGSTCYGIIVGDEAGWGDINYPSPTLSWVQGQVQVEYLGATYTSEQFISNFTKKSSNDDGERVRFPWIQEHYKLLLDEFGEPRRIQV